MIILLTCIPDTEILLRALSIKAQMVCSQMRWSGHVVRMEDSRLPKRLFYCQLKIGECPRHKPKKRLKDCVNLKLQEIDVDSLGSASK